MNRSFKVLLSTVLVACLCGTAAGAELKVGVVNYNRLLQDSPQAKVSLEAIRAEFAPRERDMNTQATQLKAREDKLQKDAATMSEIQRTAAEKELRDGYRDLQRKQGEVQDDFNARRNEEMARLQRTLVEEVQVYAKAQNFDLVLADGVIYSSSSMDITPAILAALQTKRPAAPAAKPAAPAKP